MTSATPLAHLIKATEHLSCVMKRDLHPGDAVVVSTKHSEYRLRVLGDGSYEVRGGWFDRKHNGAMVLRVAGATWGGSAIMPTVLAACGLRMEFSNRLITSPVRTITVWSAAIQN